MTPKQKLIEQLQTIGTDAPYAADPRTPIAALASAFADYLRDTPELTAPAPATPVPATPDPAAPAAL